MNSGQRQPQLSAAIAADLRRLAYVFGGQEWDKLNRPYGRLGTQWTVKMRSGGSWGRNQDPSFLRSKKKDKKGIM
ncbi:hypothetical protein PanWU01x14_299210 [Parasponia andersonii]|uniref:Uncharacterized protein n=1 Tax=Parasponia andersonii TaxID=3476 RepID=A0A2P5AUC3_PARAD|nr:hypothetical protein PanWU01x14_299210 [Parasponia andersonii]